MNQENILLCGLPESGKTTFLAALWYLIYQGEVPTALSLGVLPQNREYLNRLSGAWSRVIPIDRTATEEVQEIELQLTDNTDKGEMVLRVPDMSGETWGAVWSNRSCIKHAAEWVQNASGIMVFLHADKIRQPLDIETRNQMAGRQGQPPTNGEVTPWSPDRSPTQVVLVDILQSMALPPLGSKNRRLAVVISAWDKADDTGLTPAEYLRTYLPLLHQFLHCSGVFSEIKVFGVSALGGDLHSDSEAERLKAEDTPSKRIRVVEEGSEHHDLTVPIQWLAAR